MDYSDWKLDYSDLGYLLDRRMIVESVLLDARLRSSFDLLEPATLAKLKYNEES